MTSGITIIALGYDLYGSCAYNLALSLKAYDERIRVCLLYEPNAIKKLSEKEMDIFDQAIIMPEWEYMVNGKPQYQRAKLAIYKYTPWDFTMYMDADNIWLPEKTPSWLLGEICEEEFIIGMNGEFNVHTQRKTTNNYTYWGCPYAITKYFDIKNILPQTVSGFYAFRKCAKAEAIFKKALEVYDDPNAPCVTWANGKADEYCFNVAMALLNYRQKMYHVFYFEKLNGRLKPEDIYKNFWAIAIGGNKVPDNLIILYNKLVNKYSLMKGITTRHYHVNKMDVIPERKIF